MGDVGGRKSSLKDCSKQTLYLPANFLLRAIIKSYSLLQKDSDQSRKNTVAIQVSDPWGSVVSSQISLAI